MTSYEDSGVPPLAVINERQRVLQSLVTNLRDRFRKVELETLSNTKDINGLHEDVKTLTEAVNRGNRILMGLLVSAVLGSTSITVAILMSTAKVKLHLP
jgi:hypothetical protein